MKVISRSLKLILACVLALSATSCEKKSSPPRAERWVHLNLSREPPTLDPRKGGDIISSQMHFLLFEGLVRLNPDRTISPAQAESYDISEDRIVYTFHIRDSLWSNGTPVTAFDFEKSWKDILDPSFPSMNAHLLYPIKNAEAAKKGNASLDAVGILAKDAKTLIITLEKPTPYFLDLISFCVCYPVNSQIDVEHPDWSHHAGPYFVSNGPFVLKEWKHHNELVAMKNPTYWDQSQVRPDFIHFSMIDNEITALQMFENGQLDMIGEPLSPLSTEALPSLMKAGKLHTYSLGGTTMIAFNVDKAPFNNANIRKAFAYAIHRKEIVNNITQMGELIGVNAIPPILKGNRNRCFFADNDQTAAKALLQQGMRELNITTEAFNDVTYYYNASELHRKIAQAVQQQWMDVLGIQIKIESLDSKILMDKLIKRDYSFAQSLWAAQYNDPMNILERYKVKTNAKNYANWENPEYSRLLDASFYLNGDQRAQVLEQAEEIFLNEMPICPIYHWEMAYMVQPNLDDIGITPIGSIAFDKLALRK